MRQPECRRSAATKAAQTQLDAAGWVIGGREGAAARLGLKRTTLIYKMQRHGISRPSFDNDLEINGPPLQAKFVPQLQ